MSKLLNRLPFPSLVGDPLLVLDLEGDAALEDDVGGALHAGEGPLPQGHPVQRVVTQRVDLAAHLVPDFSHQVI